MRKLRKNSFSVSKGVIRGIILAEGALFVCGYLAWNQMCNSSDFRYRVHQTMPSVLDKFYSFLERWQGESPRLEDQIIWQSRNKPS